MKWDELREDWCPVARTMSVIGDRWTLLIVRDCLMGVTRFEALQKSLGVTRHVLTERLRRLVSAGVLEKRLYQQRPPRYDYVLTPEGEELRDVLLALQSWGRLHMPVRRPAPTDRKPRRSAQAAD